MVSYLSALNINATELEHYQPLKNIQTEMNVSYKQIVSICLRQSSMDLGI